MLASRFQSLYHRTCVLHCADRKIVSKNTTSGQPVQQKICAFKFHISCSTLSSPKAEISPDLNILNGLPAFWLKQKEIHKFGIFRLNTTVKYEIQTNKGKPLLLVDHFYGTSQPRFHMKVFNLGSNTDEAEPLAFMNRGVSQSSQTLYFVNIPPQRIISTAEVIPGFKRTIIIKDEEQATSILLISDGDVAFSKNAQILSGNGRERLGKVTRNEDKLHRDNLNIHIYCRPEWDVGIKLALVCSCVAIMGRSG